MINLISVSSSVDLSWDYTTSAYWTTIELNFAIICACVMTLKPLIAKLFPGLTDERLSSSDPDFHGAYAVGGHPPTIGTKPMRTPPANPDTSLSVFSSIDEDADTTGGQNQARGRGHSTPERSDAELIGPSSRGV